MTLSSCEAEYTAMTEVCKEILYIKNILEFLAIKVELPIEVRCDNAGAIFLTRNRESRKTKHIEVERHFIHEHVENGIIIIRFIRSNKNKTDPFTKNVSKNVLNNHFEYMQDLGN